MKLAIPRRYRTLMAGMGKVKAQVTVTGRKTKLASKERRSALTIVTRKLAAPTV